MDWTSGKAIPGLTGNARWELLDAQANRRIEGVLWLPIFAKLRLGNDGPSVRRFLSEVAERQSRLRLPSHELDLLTAASERDVPQNADLLTVVYCRADALAELIGSGLVDILEVGPPVTLPGRFEPRSLGTPFPFRKGKIACLPFVGVIDDGIGYLNARFRRDARRTRCEAVFVANADNLGANPANPASSAALLTGEELLAADIDAMLGSGRTEADLYAEQNERLFSPAVHRSTNHHAGHGTHVLDIAAGDDWIGPVASVPLLAMQLQPAAIAETTGPRLDPSIAAGLRWLIAKALGITPPGVKPAERIPLIINLSLGALAGPKDATGFLEGWIRNAIDFYHLLSGGAPIRIVIAYGNARRARLVATRLLEPGEEVCLDWRVQPDDATASFLELRTTAGSGVNVAVQIDPPVTGGILTLGAFLTLADPPLQAVNGAGQVIAELTHVPEVNADTMFLAVAPTVRDDARPVATAGAWRVTLRNGGAQPVTVSLKVQRDDTPSGFRRLGRQSWLDHRDGWTWDTETMDLAMPLPGGPVTREGTEVTYAGFVHPSVYHVAASEPDPAAGPGRYRPSRYSSEGEAAPPSSPTLAAMADEGRIVAGRRASGVVTGSTARISGTSIAAPLVTRELVELAMACALPMLVPPPDADLAEIAALIGGPPAAARDTRVGFGYVPE